MPLLGALVYGASGLGWSPGEIALCSLDSHSASLYPGVQMGTGKFNAERGAGVTLQWTSIPSRAG